MPEPPLWLHVIDWLEEIDTVGTHPLDRKRMLETWAGLALVGALPGQDELQVELAQRLHPGWHTMRADILRWNRTLLRNPAHRFRSLCWTDNPMYVIDLICERKGLAPPEDRLADLARQRAEAARVAICADANVWQDASRALDALPMAVRLLRRLRLGALETGEARSPDDPIAERPTRPTWWTS